MSEKKDILYSCGTINFLGKKLKAYGTKKEKMFKLKDVGDLFGNKSSKLSELVDEENKKMSLVSDDDTGIIRKTWVVDFNGACMAIARSPKTKGLPIRKMAAEHLWGDIGDTPSSLSTATTENLISEVCEDEDDSADSEHGGVYAFNFRGIDGVVYLGSSDIAKCFEKPHKKVIEEIKELKKAIPEVLGNEIVKQNGEYLLTKNSFLAYIKTFLEPEEDEELSDFIEAILDFYDQSQRNEHDRQVYYALNVISNEVSKSQIHIRQIDNKINIMVKRITELIRNISVLNEKIDYLENKIGK